MGVDIRVTNSVIFGLAASMEDLLQEGGRVMRGSPLETGGQHGLSFFFHKGAIGKKKFTFDYLFVYSLIFRS